MHEQDAYYHSFYHYPPSMPYAPVQHAGLMGVAGGMINLATTMMFGGARVVRTIVEGSLWHAEHPPYHRSSHPCHVCHVCCGCCP